MNTTEGIKKSMNRVITFKVTAYDPKDAVDLDAAAYAIADFCAREWNANVDCSIESDSSIDDGALGAEGGHP